ncbi:LOW QUALITY PROTEIN: diphthine methyltransferase-like [Trifolium pratense]|uniref:LOW QUALITY PROTEIN: diphthine methyltransferase-like n=1 Tax=Trifolium pratense TaxID=57577 RepID=UPI001E693C0D|nr:LOW QUALITY PROTEIN: diphthine methyltransferase-like [Trifolium pratense]
MSGYYPCEHVKNLLVVLHVFCYQRDSIVRDAKPPNSEVIYEKQKVQPYRQRISKWLGQVSERLEALNRRAGSLVANQSVILKTYGVVTIVLKYLLSRSFHSLWLEILSSISKPVVTPSSKSCSVSECINDEDAAEDLTSNGANRLWNMDRTYLKEITSEKISDSMCLFLKISTYPSATSTTVGLSDDSVSIVSLRESKLEVQEWKAHNFELWTTSFDIHQLNLVYNGSDDCRFCCWDLRDSPSNLVFKNSKVHTMGVTCIEKNPHDPNRLLTGSYDEFLRVWDLRSISKPINETSISLGGGVWRVKHHPFIQGLVFSACMHNGFVIVAIKDDKAEVLETYKKHDSLAYGADWQKVEANHV